MGLHPLICVIYPADNIGKKESVLKIAVSAEGVDLNARASGRLGTSAYFIVVDTQTMAFEAIANPGAAGYLVGILVED